MKSKKSLIGSILAIIIVAYACKKENNETDENIHASKDWLNQNVNYGTVSDSEGNKYATIKIGNQVWMAENLKSTKFANGESIPNLPALQDWLSTSSAAWVYYENDPAYNKTFGKIYNGFAAQDERNICPAGWHVPTIEEWTTLIENVDPNYGLGSTSIARRKMMTSGFKYWKDPTSLGATNIDLTSNESGFSVVGSGRRASNGAFADYKILSGFWSKTSGSSSDNSKVIYYTTYNNSLSFAPTSNSGENNVNGLCVRCLKD